MRSSSPSVLLSVALLCAACSSTGIEESWVDPTLRTLPPGQKVFVAYLGAEAAVQRLAEDAMAERIRAPEVVRCYALFPDAKDLKPSEVTAKLRDQSFDTAIVMRLMGIEQEVSWSPSAYSAGPYRTFGGYWASPVDSGMLYTSEIVHVETNVYALAEDKLVYAARSESFEPGSTKALIDEIAGDIADDLRAKGIVRADGEVPR